MDIIRQFLCEHNPELLFQDTLDCIDSMYSDFIRRTCGTTQNTNLTNTNHYYSYITSRIATNIIEVHRSMFEDLQKTSNDSENKWHNLEVFDIHPESESYTLTIEYETNEKLQRTAHKLYLFRINFGKNEIHFVSSLSPKENDIFSANKISKSLFSFQTRADCKAKFKQILQALTYQWVSKEANKCLNVFAEEEANKLENMYIYRDPYVNAKDDLDRMIAADCFGNVYKLCNEKGKTIQGNCNFKLKKPKLQISVAEFIELDKYKKILAHIRSLYEQECFRLILNPKETFPFTDTSIWRHLSNLFQTETCNFLSEEQYAIFCKCIAPGNEGSMVSYVRTAAGSGCKRIVRMLISAFYSFQYSINKFYLFNNNIPKILGLTHSEHYVNNLIEEILTYQLLVNSGYIYLPEYLKVANEFNTSKPYNIGAQVDSFLKRFNEEDLKEIMKDLEKDKQQIEIDLKYLEVELEKAKQESKTEEKYTRKKSSNEMEEIRNKYFNLEKENEKAHLKDSYISYISFCILYLQEELNRKETDLLRLRTMKTFDDQSARNFCLKNFLVNSPIVFTSEENLKEKNSFKLLEDHSFDYLIIVEVDKVQEINFLRFVDERTKKIVFIENNFDIRNSAKKHNKKIPASFIDRLAQNGMQSLDVLHNIQQSDQLKNSYNYILGNQTRPKQPQKLKKRVGLGLDFDDDILGGPKKAKTEKSTTDFGIMDDVDVWYINIMENENFEFIKDVFYIVKEKLNRKLIVDKDINKIGLVVDGSQYLNVVKKIVEDEMSELNIEVVTLDKVKGKTFDLVCFLYDRRYEDKIFVNPECFLYSLTATKAYFWVVSYDYYDLGTSANRYIDAFKEYLTQISAFKNVEYVQDKMYKVMSKTNDEIKVKKNLDLNIELK
eukprot:GAHX01001897.1.p1 GENE.GAHX01001897.1~~GAHX01001897.1.p1  ORF type:complete len:891 (+),score=194.62 GAHX01001897.1:58-2730(+)